MFASKEKSIGKSGRQKIKRSSAIKTSEDDLETSQQEQFWGPPGNMETRGFPRMLLIIILLWYASRKSLLSKPQPSFFYEKIL